MIVLILSGASKMPKKKELAAKSAGGKLPSLSRPLPPTHIQKVGTQLELEVVVKEEKGDGDSKLPVSRRNSDTR